MFSSYVVYVSFMWIHMAILLMVSPNHHPTIPVVLRQDTACGNREIAFGPDGKLKKWSGWLVHILSYPHV